MNAKKIISYGQQARGKLLSGINKLTQAVKVTFGGAGKNVVFDQPYGQPPESTRDGVTVAREFDLKDPQEKQGADMLRKVALNVNDDCGDGTSSAIIIAQALIENGFAEIKEGANPVKLSKELNKAVADIVKQLKKESQKVTTKEQMAQIGTIASRDEDIGNLVAEVMDETGEDGVVDVQESQGIETTKEVVKGIKLDKGYISPYFITDPKKMTCEYHGIDILITDHKISDVEDLVPLITTLGEQKTKKLMIIADDVTESALAALVVNRIQGKFKPLAIKAPSFGDNKREVLQDIAVITGGTFVTEETGMKITDVTPDMLGRADRVVSSKSETIIVGGQGDQKELETRLTQVKAAEAVAESDYDKENLKKRIAGLSGGVAVIKVGATSELEQKEKKYRVEDAVAAVAAGMAEGIIEGGGLPLLRIAEKLKESSPVNRILKKSLAVPFNQIIENGGEDLEKILTEAKKKKLKEGYDIVNAKFGDMFEMGIIDPVKVTRSALENAASVASSVLITETTIAIEPEKESPPVPQGGGMPPM
jgi:chaperonin GroEL